MAVVGLGAERMDNGYGYGATESGVAMAGEQHYHLNRDCGLENG